MAKNILDWIALVLVIIGAINLGLFGINGTDLIQMIFSFNLLISKIVYILIGLAGLYMIYFLMKKN